MEALQVVNSLPVSITITFKNIFSWGGGYGLRRDISGLPSSKQNTVYCYVASSLCGGEGEDVAWGRISPFPTPLYETIGTKVLEHV